MATIKSHTDIKQSKKLADILPLESADMCWQKIYDENHMMSDYRVELIPYRLYGGIGVPCWSLAALYSILPNNEKESTTLSRGGWKIDPIKYLDNWWCEYEDDNYTKDFTVSGDNPVDACVAMIEKLNELNLL